MFRVDHLSDQILFPQIISNHLDSKLMPSQIGRCKQRDEHVEEHAAVVVKLRKRSSDSQNAKALAEKKAFQKAKAIREKAGAAALQRTVEAGGGGAS